MAGGARLNWGRELCVGLQHGRGDGGGSDRWLGHIQCARALARRVRRRGGPARNTKAAAERLQHVAHRRLELVEAALEARHVRLSVKVTGLAQNFQVGPIF